jgi:hypothetical protein
MLQFTPLMRPSSFLHFIAIALFTSLGSLACSGSSECVVTCPAALTKLSAPKPVTSAVSKTSACYATTGCGTDGGPCSTVEVDLGGTGRCEIAVTYADGTTFTFVSNVSQTSGGCCPAYALDNTTLGT